MPDPADYDSKDAFMAACVPDVIGEGEDQEAAVGKCNGMWEDHVNANKATRKEATHRHVAPVVNVDVADARREAFDGRDYRVVPVVMAVGDTVMNEAFVPDDELARSVPAWNGRPLPVDHPEANGRPISANSPDVLEKVSVGQVFNVKFEDNRLKGELWIDEAKANERAPEVLERLDAGSLEVSTAYFSADEATVGTAPDGTEFRVVHHALLPDHLALLPDSKGACGWEDGCGAPRVNEADRDDGWLKKLLARVTGNARHPSGEIDTRELETRLMQALEEELEKPVFVETVFFENGQVVYEVLDPDTPPGLRMRSYSIADEDRSVTFEDDVQEVTRVVSFEPVSNESDGDGGQPQAATTTANQGEDQMDERIKGLIDNERAPFTEDDAETLKAFTDEKLEKLVATYAEAPAAHDAGTGDDGEGDDEPAGEETLEAHIAKQPPALREPLQAMLRDHQAKRTGLIERIKANEANAFSEEELATFSDASLEKLARVAGTEDDYSGQAVHAHGGKVTAGDDEPYVAPSLVDRIRGEKEA